MASIKGKEVAIFDMDGTLAESKSKADREMVGLILKLLEKKRMAVIGGGSYAIFKEQLMSQLPARDPRLTNLFLFPTTATAFYRYSNGWKKVYAHFLSKKEVAQVMKAFKEVFREMQYVNPKKTYGPVIENRKSQISFSALGQKVVAVLGKKGVAMKEEWKKKNTPIKLEMARRLAKRLPGLEVHAAGYTTIDITHKGIDKAYGVRQIEKILHIPIRKMVFVGDALFPGGNDYAAKKTGIDAIPVKGPADTKRIIRTLIKD